MQETASHRRFPDARVRSRRNGGLVGINVWFTGSPHPKPGKKYPQAYTVRITGAGTG